MSGMFYTIRRTLRNYLQGGNMLLIATVLALLVVNLPATRDFYNSLWTHEVALQIGSFNLFSHNGHPMSLMQFINDALMAIFFFSVGLEIKREVLVGELRSVRRAMLPILGACGGMIVPVVIFFLCAQGTPYERGCAIPMATDIAFSLGVLSMLGSRVPISLKIFLTTLAVVDDLGGILVIAIFYSDHINISMLLWSLLPIVLLLLGGRMRIQSKIFYMGVGIIVWFLFLQAGIHPTIAGVIVAFCVPARPIFNPTHYVQIIRKNIAYFVPEKDEALSGPSTILDHDQMNLLKEIESASDKVISPLQELEDSLHPIVNWIIMPLFAFANAGIYLGGLTPEAVVSGVSLSIILGLVVGKFLGILSFSWLAVKCGIAAMPSHSNWKMMGSVAVLGGIGFTVSLFIANLSFGTGDPYFSELLNEAKLGIVVGSLAAGLIGWSVLHLTLPKAPAGQNSKPI